MASALSLWGVLSYFLQIVKEIGIPHFLRRQIWQVLPKNSVRGRALASSCSHALDGEWLLTCQLTLTYGLACGGRWTGTWLFFASQLRQETHSCFFKKVAPWGPAHMRRSGWHTENVNSVNRSWHDSLKCKSAVCAPALSTLQKGKIIA